MIFKIVAVMAHSLLLLSANSTEVQGMRRVTIYMISAAFLLTAIAFAADQPASGTPKANTVKVAPVRIAKMNATGKVIEISDKVIKIERKVRDKVETMEFILDKPVENIAVNDAVKIAYLEKDGKLVASKVAKAGSKKTGKKEAVAETTKK